MTTRFSLDEIRRYWTDQARKHGVAPSASWSDTNVIEMEVQELLKYLYVGDSVLDIGCANGFSTVQLAAQKDIVILGLDFIPEMIEQARARAAGLGVSLASRVSFMVGDILDLGDRAGGYDKVIVTRVLINLGDWERQCRALGECARMLRSGGLLLLSEATLQGWKNLNCFRSEWGLPEIPMPSFNHYIDQDLLLEEARLRFDLVEVSNFASTYYVGTRVLKPLMNQALGGRVEVASPDMEWNRWFASLPASGDYGTQKLFVFRKR